MTMLKKVLPLFKSGAQLNVDNYRPISLLTVISKFLEKVVYKQTYNHFDKHKLFIIHNTVLGTKEVQPKLLASSLVMY